MPENPYFWVNFIKSCPQHTNIFSFPIMNEFLERLRVRHRFLDHLVITFPDFLGHILAQFYVQIFGYADRVAAARPCLLIG